MESLDRRTFVQAAVSGALTATVLAVPSAQAAGPGDYFVIAEIVAKPGSADALRALLVPFAENRATSQVASSIHCLKLNRSLAAS